MSTSLIYPAIDAAIAAFETGGNPQSAAALANNPGALTAPGGQLTTQEVAAGATGTTAVAGGQYLATFPTAAQGQQAEDNLVAYYAGQGDTLSQLITNWSIGPGGTPTQTTQNYINSVVAAVPGSSASTPVSQLAGVGSSSGTSGGITGALSSISSAIGSLSWGRVGAFILGAVLIVGAVILIGKSDLGRDV